MRVSRPRYLLAADIGGTRARFRVIECSANGWRIRHEITWPSGSFDSLEHALEHCLEQLSRPERAGLAAAWLAVAGPVQNQEVRFTNLPWETSAAALAPRLGLPAVHLVNDLEAIAHGMPSLTPDERIPLQAGVVQHGPGLVISVGTGLGMAAWHEIDGKPLVFPTEAGHIDFAPQGASQDRLLQELRAIHGHVSYEHLLSGSGLVHLYEFTCREAGTRPSPALESAPDPAAVVTRLADRERDPNARTAIDLCGSLLGTFAGNGALQWLATGGVHLCGGVIDRIHPYLEAGAFLYAFRHKGRMRRLMERIPIAVITRREAGLEGITRLAIREHGIDDRRARPV